MSDRFSLQEDIFSYKNQKQLTIEIIKSIIISYLEIISLERDKK